MIIIIRCRKKLILGAASLILLVGTLIVYNDSYRKLVGNQDKVITVGVFSDSYWEVPNGYSYRILEDAITVFESEHPGVRVEYVSGILKEDYSEWLSEQLLLGKAPDIFFVLSKDFNNLAEIGAFKDLTLLIEGDGEFDKEAFYSSAYEYGKYRVNQYSLPYECAPKLMFVNKTILDKEGIGMPDDEWTWEDFYEICRRVTKDTDGNAAIDQFGVAGYTWQEAFEANGISLFNEQGTECYFADDDVETALVFMEKLEKLNSGYTVTSRDFDLGRVAFQPMSFSKYRAYKPYPLSVKKYSGFEWECVPMPAGPEGDNISTLDTLLLAMNKNTKKTRYSWELMKLLTYDARIQSEIFEYSEGVSVLKAVTESDKTLQSLIESSGDENSLKLSVLSKAVEKAVVAPRFGNYNQAMSEVDKAVNGILSGSSNFSMEQIIWNRNINKRLTDNEW